MLTEMWGFNVFQTLTPVLFTAGTVSQHFRKESFSLMPETKVMATGSV